MFQAADLMLIVIELTRSSSDIGERTAVLAMSQPCQPAMRLRMCRFDRACPRQENNRIRLMGLGIPDRLCDISVVAGRMRNVHGDLWNGL